MIRIKNFTLKSRVIQSPMAGCTDLAFRLIAREHGMEFAFLEMISAESLVRKNQQAHNLMKTTAEDKPVGAQLVGCKPDVMAGAAEILEGMGYDWIDINMGCPVPKIVSPGGGSALLIEPQKARDIFSAMVKTVKKVPLTVKMRIGFNDASGEEAVRVAKIAEECGMDAISVHGRTRAQGYSGAADWNAIGKVKRAVKIPVFGNGDVTKGADALRMIEQSGCDGVMVGRGALGNPWIYKEVEQAMQTGDLNRPAASLEEKRAVLLKHLDYETRIEGEKMGVLKMRRVACWYFAGYPNNAAFRGAVNKAESKAEFEELIRGFNAAPGAGAPAAG